MLRAGLFPGFEEAKVVEESAGLVTIRSGPNRRFLVNPFTAAINGAVGDRHDVGYLPSGFLHYEEDSATQVPAARYGSELITSDARLVTMDASVWLAGVRASEFEAGEVIFVSAALVADFVASFTVRGKPGGQRTKGTRFGYWRHTEPIPLDQPVLQLAHGLAIEAAELATGKLSRTDLLCAAAALHYGAKLYTTDPTKYAGIGRGLITAQYGEALPTPPPPPPSWANTKAGFKARSLANADLIEPLHDETIPLPERAEFVIDVFLDLRSPDDRGWISAILAVSDRLPFRELEDWHRAELILAVSHACRGHLSREASTAIGRWGIWPTDASSEVLDDLEYDDSDPATLSWYRGYLLMAGLDEASADEEIDLTQRGESHASRERISALTS